MIVTRQNRNEEPLRHRKVAYHELPGPTPRRFFFYRSNSELPGAPLMVSVHGIARNAAAHVYKLVDEAERYGLNVVAPLFEKETYGQYQQLIDDNRRVRADAALLDILAAASRLSKSSIDRILLFGFSGGAQFSHRFVLAHAGRVASAVHASAGWYTFPDASRRYPYGLRWKGSPAQLDLAAALRIPQHVVVGDLDVERDGSLRQTERLDVQQGGTRVMRARRWVEAMSAAARGVEGGVAPTLSLLPGVTHSFADAVEMGCLPRHVFDRFARDANLALIS